VAAGGGGTINLSNDCILFLKLDDNDASTTVTDSSQNNANYTMYNSSGTPINTSTQYNAMDGTPNPDSVGGYFDFASDAYASRTDTGQLDVGLGDYSIAAWIRTSSKVAHEKVFSVDIGGTANMWAMLYIKSGDGYARCSVHGGATSVGYFSAGGTPTDLSDGAWHHVVMVVDRSAEELTVYVDGLQDGTTTDISSVAGQDTFSYEAASAYVAGDIADPEFTGDVAQIMLFDKELTSDEVIHLYNSSEGTQLLADEGSLPDQAATPSPSDSATGQASTLDLSWASASGADSYDVYLGTSSPPSAVDFIENTTTTTTNIELSGGTTYYWRVDSRNTYGVTSGAVWSFTTIVDAPPQVEPSETVAVKLSWTAVDGATGYNVYLGTDPTPSASELVSSNQTSTFYDPSGLIEGTEYYWRVDSVNAGGTTEGEIWSFTAAASTLSQRMRARYGG
jgi:hypothetical protein